MGRGFGEVIRRAALGPLLSHLVNGGDAPGAKDYGGGGGEWWGSVMMGFFAAGLVN